MRVIAIGRTQMLYGTIERLLATEHTVCGIVTGRAQPEYVRTPADFEQLARDHGIPFLLARQLHAPEAAAWLDDREADTAVSVNWRYRVLAETRAKLRHGVLNAHCGDLPRFRGNAAVTWAMASGESRITVTIHEMRDGIDDGPVLVRGHIPLTGEPYIAEVQERVETLIPDLFVQAVDGLERGALTPVEQPTDPALAQRCHPRSPRDGEIDWSAPAATIARQVRANAEPYAGAYTFLGLRVLTVWRARAESLPTPFLGAPGQVASRDPKTGEVAVLASDGVVVLEQVALGDGDVAAPCAVLRTIHTRLGLDKRALVCALARLTPGSDP